MNTCKIVCVRETDDPVEAMILIKRIDAEGVLAPPGLMAQMEAMKHFITKQPQLNCRIKGPLTEVDAFKQKEGVTLHWLPPTIVIKGQRWKNLGGNETRYAEMQVVDLRVGITDYNDKVKSFTIIDGGVTGYESVWISKDFIDNTCRRGWTACFGGCGWDRLFIPADQMKRAHEELYTRVYENQAC